MWTDWGLVYLLAPFVLGASYILIRRLRGQGVFGWVIAWLLAVGLMLAWWVM